MGYDKRPSLIYICTTGLLWLKQKIIISQQRQDRKEKHTDDRAAFVNTHYDRARDDHYDNSGC